MIREIFKDAEIVRSGRSHLPQSTNGVISSLSSSWETDKPPDIWNSHGKSGHVFASPPASSSSPYPGGFNPWICNVTKHTSPHVTNGERQIPDTALNSRFQSGPSAKNSVIPSEGRFSKDYGADQQRLQILGTSL